MNVWVGITSQSMALFWTGLIEPDQRPLTCSGRGRYGEGNLFWMLWSSLFSVRGWTHHAPLLHSINTDWHRRAHNKTSRHSMWRLRQIAHTFFNTLGLKCISYNLSITLHPKPPPPFPEKYVCVSVCLWDRETARMRCLLYQCFVNFLDALHVRAIGVVLKIVNLLFRMSLHPSKSK